MPQDCADRFPYTCPADEGGRHVPEHGPDGLYVGGPQMAQPRSLIEMLGRLSEERRAEMSREDADKAAAREAAEQSRDYRRSLPAPVLARVEATRPQRRKGLGRRGYQGLLVALRGAALILVAALALFARPAVAQHPRWDVWRTSVDQFGPWELRGPRVGIEALRAGLGAETYRALRVASLPPRYALPVAVLANGVAPHAIGLARGAYRVNTMDFAADAWIAGGPAVVVWAFERTTSRKARIRTLGAYLVGWGILAGWASP